MTELTKEKLRKYLDKKREICVKAKVRYRRKSCFADSWMDHEYKSLAKMVKEIAKEFDIKLGSWSIKDIK